MRNAPTAIALAAILLPTAGCWTPPRPTPAQRDAGLVWLFPGVEGGQWQVEWPYRAFRDAGVAAEIEVHDWWHPFGTIVNLTSYDRNRRDAARVATRIADYRRTNPDAPIDLVGYSGGGGLAIMVTEALPVDVHVRNVVLVQAAISPDYNLTAALEHIDGKLVNYFVPSDWAILGIGTATLGTMDRQYTASAGMVGLRPDENTSDPALRDKIVQHRWNGKMLVAAHFGDHLSIVSYPWNKKYVAPWLLGGAVGSEE